MLTASNREYVWWPDAVSPAVLPRYATLTRRRTYRPLSARPRTPKRWTAVTFDRHLAAFGERDVIPYYRSPRSVLHPIIAWARRPAISPTGSGLTQGSDPRVRVGPIIT